MTFLQHKKRHESKRQFLPCRAAKRLSRADVEEQEKLVAKFKRKSKARVFRFLDTRKGKWSQYYHTNIIFLILVSLALGIGSTINGYEKGWLFKFRLAVETILLIIFLTEYLLRVWSSGAHGTYGAVGGWKKYVVTPHMIIDLLVILSSLGLVISSSVLKLDSEEQRLLHLLQLLRILRIDRQRGAFGAFWRVFKKHRKELLTCWYMGFLMVTFVSFLVYSLEEKRSHDTYTFTNLFDGVYWGVISLTTIGYGDLKPETTSGKLLICCFAVFGTCFLAMPAGIIGSGFALQVAEQQKEKHVNRRRRPAAVLIQCFWRKYAADHDYPATWLPHTQTREEKNRKLINPKSPKGGEMFGVPFTPILPTIQVARTENGKTSPPARILPTNLMGDPLVEDLQTSSPWMSQKKVLTTAEKIALRFIRFLKCISSMKKFRQARRPYDERDILDQFASSQIEMFAKLRDVKQRVDSYQSSNENRTNQSMEYMNRLDNKILNLHTEVSEMKQLLKALLRQHQQSETQLEEEKSENQ